ncbi:Crp/Fnr family transcriptional regulator [Desulfuromonas sp. TF]|uniref:Crp/Fnr family transcriptional regulator n=1 Tax=Desulfuromonas sp. TF TaxID=1232410 RepID=UPI0004193E57|nr:cyclic nucleotide-binding domain-containing protein [Desulfuromonas sp. TF]
MNLLWSNIFRKKPEEESLAFFLGTVPVFSELEGRELAYLESLVHIRRYSPGEIVFEEGDTGSGMYVIRTGKVEIFLRNAEGREEPLALLGPGDFFGETTLTAPTSRTASARTLESAELFGLFRADLLKTVQRHPGIASKILLGLTRIISERLQATGQEIRRLQAAAAASAAPTGTDSEEGSHESLKQ